MINMENRKITPESIIKNSEHDCTPTIILYKTQWHTVYDWMQEYSDQQNKRLLDEIEELKSQISLLEVQLKSSKQDVEMLKFELKAADSVNENLSKQIQLTCVDCGKSDDTVKDRGAFNGIQCYACKKEQDIDDEECR